MDIATKVLAWFSVVVSDKEQDLKKCFHLEGLITYQRFAM